MAANIKEGGVIDNDDDDSFSERMFDPQIKTGQIPLHPMPVRPMPIINPLDNVSTNSNQLRTTNMTSNHYIPRESQQKEKSSKGNVIIYIALVITILLSSYSAMGVTYLLFYKQQCSCSSSQQFSTSDLAPNITSSPPTTTAPTPSPTLPPSSTPITSLPTTAPSFSNYMVGDYKISAQATSHGHWLLCDGSFIDSTNYPELFSIIQHSFGSFAGYPLLFRLPDLSDNLIGLTGSNHSMGESVGAETGQLSEDNIPSHFHYLACKTHGTATSYSSSTPYLAYYSSAAGDPWFYWFGGAGKPWVPNQYESSSIGNGTSFNIMPPTVFVGNLFIYSG